MVQSIHRHSKVVLFGARLSLGFLFLVSSIPKIHHPYDFLIDIYNYQLTGPALSKFVAMVLPWLEFLLGMSLIGGVFLGGCFAIATLLTLLFGCAQGSALLRGLSISCGCFGSLAPTNMISYGSLLRVTIMLVIAITGYLAWLPEARCAGSTDRGDYR